MVFWRRKKRSDDPAPRPEDPVESSMNFDAFNVKPFLERVSGSISEGFGQDEIDRIVSLLTELQVDEEKELTFSITHDGQPVELRVLVVLDDVDSPNLYFFSPRQLAAQIDAEMHRLCEEQGI